jgi:paraquat-inducible protein B
MSATKPAVIGGFVLSGFALGIIAILLFGNIRLFSTTQQAVVLFPGSVAGLTVGAPVTFRGVQVGTVQRISVLLDVKDLKANIPVYLDLRSNSVSMINGKLPADAMGMDRLLEAGLKAQLNQSSFVTGQLQVDLDLRPDIHTSPTGIDLGVPEIPAMPSQGLQLRQLEDTAQQVGDTAKQTLESIQRVSDQLGNRIGPLIDDVQKTSGSAREMLQITANAIRQIQADADRALGSADKALGNADKTLGDVDRLVVEGGQQLTARGNELSRVLIEAEHTMHEAELLTVSLKDMTSPRSQTRGDLEAAVRDLAATASSLREFSHEIERNPSLVLTGSDRQ